MVALKAIHFQRIIGLDKRSNEAEKFEIMLEVLKKIKAIRHQTAKEMVLNRALELIRDSRCENFSIGYCPETHKVQFKPELCKKKSRRRKPAALEYYLMFTNQ